MEPDRSHLELCAFHTVNLDWNLLVGLRGQLQRLEIFDLKFSVSLRFIFEAAEAALKFI